MRTFTVGGELWATKGGYRLYAKMATIDFCYLVKFLQPLMVQHQKEMK